MHRQVHSTKGVRGVAACKRRAYLNCSAPRVHRFMARVPFFKLILTRPTEPNVHVLDYACKGEFVSFRCEQKQQRNALTSGSIFPQRSNSKTNALLVLAQLALKDMRLLEKETVLSEATQSRVAGVSSLCASLTFSMTISGLWAHSNAGLITETAFNLSKRVIS